MHVVCYSPDQALSHFISHVFNGRDPRVVSTASRNGNVLRVNQPVIVEYREPLNRVMFNPVRDCNPFFHLFESMWMLAGRNDLEPLLFFNSKFGQFSDDGVLVHGAYGQRWRDAFGLDQLTAVIDHLKRNPGSRRSVVSMWHPSMDVPLLDDGRDVACNLICTFDIIDNKLNITVFNRSNDLIWGMLGANVVQFSFLQEYMANCIGVEVGTYYQITNNLHVYDWNYTPDKWLEGNRLVPHCYPQFDRINLVEDKQTFDREVQFVTDFPEAFKFGQLEDLESTSFQEPFLRKVVHPANIAYGYHKERDYDKAQSWVDGIVQKDWRIACRQWINRRKENYLKKLEKGEVTDNG